MSTKELYDKYMITGMVAGFVDIEVEKANACTMTGTDGKEYLDCFSGISVTNAGHGHPAVVSAAKEQMEKLVHCCTYVYYNPRAGELVQKLAEITPGKLQKSFLGNSGAEAIEGALRIAKQHTGKKEVVALTMSFHGRTAATLSITGNRGRKKGSGPYMSGIAFAPAPYCYRCPFKLKYPSCGCACAEFMDNVLKYQTSGDVATFIAEPVMGEGGIITPPDEYFKIVTDIVRNEGAVYICDEVQSGFGRTGKMFGIEHYGVEPEIMTMAKGIADGFPLSSFTVEPEIADAFKPGDHLSTFGGSPISCAAALANIDVLQKEKIVENAEARGKQLIKRFNEMKEKYSIIGDVRGKGLMIGIEMISDSNKTPASAEAKAIRSNCFDNGLCVGLGGVLANVIRFQPPLVITEEEADKAADIFEKAVASVSK